MTLGTNEQKFLPAGTTEIQTALPYLEISQRYGVKTTLFITGKSFLEEWHDLKPILSYSLNEVGGHTFNAFSPKLPYRVFKKFFGSFNGPSLIQSWDIRRTINIIYKRTGKKISSWRNHAYWHDDNTNALLFEKGIRVVSDKVDPQHLEPFVCVSGIVELPLNVIPDHEHLIHAHRTTKLQEYIHSKYSWKDKFGWEAYSPADWLKKVICQVNHIEENGGVATVLMHPLCMYSADRYGIFEEFCRFAASRTSLFASEAATLGQGKGNTRHA